MKTMRVGIVGSAFNPPHLGHKDILEQISHEFDEVLLIPSYRHAFGKVMEPYESRLYMASVMADAFNREQINNGRPVTPILVSDIERTIGQGNQEPVYTYHVLSALENRYSATNTCAQLTFVLGPDNANFDTWKQFYRSDEIRNRWALRSVSERLKVHSSEIRELIANYPRPESLFQARFSQFLDHSIADYIYHHNLYGARL